MKNLLSQKFYDGLAAFPHPAVHMTQKKRISEPANLLDLVIVYSSEARRACVQEGVVIRRVRRLNNREDRAFLAPRWVQKLALFAWYKGELRAAIRAVKKKGRGRPQLDLAKFERAMAVVTLGDRRALLEWLGFRPPE
jgi:hypothetical protein